MAARVAVIGATGIVGQQFLVALDKHPWFQVTRLAASARSAGKPYHQAIRDASTGASRWLCDEPLPAAFHDLHVEDAATFDPGGLDLVFTGVEEGEVAKELEPRLAARVPVVSTASAFRMETDVPLIIPGINARHLPLVTRQRTQRGWKGWVLPICNCTTTGLAITLKPLLDAVGLRTVHMVSMQSLSGAGRSPGVSALDILDNVIPYIPKEEEKVQREVRKVLGTLTNDTIEPSALPLSAICTRVNVRDGHTEAVFASTDKLCSTELAQELFACFKGDLDGLALPSAPQRPIVVHTDPYRPQPRLDRNTDQGMATTVGRINTHDVEPNGLKWVLVSHNTRMGAARGAVLLGELAYKQGLL